MVTIQTFTLRSVISFGYCAAIVNWKIPMRRERDMRRLLPLSLAIALGIVIPGIIAGCGSEPAESVPLPASTSTGVSPSEADVRRGALIQVALLKRATDKVMPGGDGGKWLSGLPRGELEALLLTKLYSGIRLGALERIVEEGYGDEIPKLMRILEKDINTDSSRRVSAGLKELSPFIARGVKPFEEVEPGGHWVSARAEDRQRVLERLNEQLEPVAEDFDRDVKAYFAREY